MRARKGVAYTVTALVRVTESQVVETHADIGVGALRARLRDATFTRQRLKDLVESHPREFPGAAKDIDSALDDLRERFNVEISEDDFIEDRESSDPPRSARITISFTAANPQTAWQITQALVDLMIDSTQERERAALLREQAGAESALERAQQHLDDAKMPTAEPVTRLKAQEAQVAAVRIGLRAAGEQQTLRFDLVDPGRVPPVASHGGLVGDAIVTFALALLAVYLLSGAFDPRVVETADVTTLGMRVLGQLPMLPPAPGRRASGDGNKQDTPSPGGDEPGTRV